MRNTINKLWQGAMYGSLGFMIIVLTGLYTGLIINAEKYIILSAELGTFVLFWMLLSKNISKYTKKKKGENSLMQFIRFNALRQREMGITSFNFFALHVIIAIIVVLNAPLELIRQIVSGAAVTMIFIYLIITSIKGMQAKKKTWKSSHSIVWMAFPLIIFHIYELEPTIPSKYIIMFIILIISVFIGLGIKMAQKRSIRQVKISFASLIFIGLQLVILTILSAYNSINATKQVNNNVASQDADVETTEVSKVNENTEASEDTDTNEELNSDETTSSTDNLDSSASSTDNNLDTSSTTTSAYTDGTYQGIGTGYHGGQTGVSVTVANGKITTINIDSIQDTPGFYETAVQVIPQEIIDSQSTDVQTVSGATFSSIGIMSAVDDALSQA